MEGLARLKDFNTAKLTSAKESNKGQSSEQKKNKIQRSQTFIHTEHLANKVISPIGLLWPRILQIGKPIIKTKKYSSVFIFKYNFIVNTDKTTLV